MSSLLVAARNPSAWTGPTGNNTYLFTGAVPTLIDAGVGHPDHVDAVARALGGAALAQVLVTHGHQDHVSGAGALRSRWPGVRIRKLPLPGQDAGVEPIEDGETLAAGDTELDAIATPGHSPDHCCFLERAAGDVYCGDLVRAGGTVVIAASRGGNLAEYLASLENVRALAPRRLLPGHGPVIEEPASIIDAYVLHRTQREKQVVTALGDGLDTVEAIAARIYPDIDAALRPAAVDTVLAHLIKLEADGIAASGDRRWSLTAKAG
jgi:glyoxylase-like metal-dependent hydrolase (beta-lactamase superfamily II)